MAKACLERLGLDSINDLPALGEFFPEADVVEALERGLRVADDEVADDEVVLDAQSGTSDSSGS